MAPPWRLVGLAVAVFTGTFVFAAPADPMQSLREACRTSNIAKVREIPLEGLNLNKRDQTGRSLLQWAIEGNSTKPAERREVVLWLLDHGADLRSMGIKPPIAIASGSGWDAGLIELLIQRGASVNGDDRPGSDSPLHIAAGRCDDELVAFLLAHGADPKKCRVTEQGTPLGTLFANAGSFENEKTRNRALVIAKALLDAGTDPNIPDANGRNALCAAACASHLECVREFLTRGVDPMVLTGKGHTILQEVSMSRRYYDPRVLEFLLTRTPELIDVQDAAGNTALHLAVSHGNAKAIQSLLLAGASTTLRNKKNERALDLLGTMQIDDGTAEMLRRYTPSERPPVSDPEEGPQIPPRHPQQINPA